MHPLLYISQDKGELYLSQSLQLPDGKKQWTISAWGNKMTSTAVAAAAAAAGSRAREKQLEKETVHACMWLQRWWQHSKGREGKSDTSRGDIWGILIDRQSQRAEWTDRELTAESCSAVSGYWLQDKGAKGLHGQRTDTDRMLWTRLILLCLIASAMKVSALNRH